MPKIIPATGACFIKIRTKYWIILLFGLGIFAAPLIFRFWEHANDIRASMLSGALVGSASIWTLGDNKVRWLPVFVIHVTGWILSGFALIFSVLGDTHLLINLLPFSSLLVMLTWADAIWLWAGNHSKKDKST